MTSNAPIAARRRLSVRRSRPLLTDPLTSEQVFKVLLPLWRRGPDVLQEAAERIDRGWYVFFHGRSDRAPYLLRMWNQQPRRDEKNEWDSADSDMTHWFPRGDDDRSLHDHPWDFVTRIMRGGYIEHLPPVAWERARLRMAHPEDALGPAWNKRKLIRRPGDEVAHAAEDLHCVGRLLVPLGGDEFGGGCWTRVRTFAQRRSWGFHPYNRRRVHWRDYIRPSTLELSAPAAEVPA